MLAGCLLVLLCAAGAGATFVIEQVRGLQDALGQNHSVDVGSGILAQSAYGGPETLLLVGNDERKHTTTAPVLPHSNEMLLVRIDPGRPYISMMSIPRELEVTITPPGQGPVTTRLNYAYTAGGIPLLVSTIKRVTGLGVNHVVVIDFQQFRNAVNDLGCVYSTIDRRYFHVNTPTSAQYQEINLQPGYQDLCGTQALQFVSYRHGDTSLVRDARDQAFLLSAKRQYGPTLADNIDTFERIFGRTVSTDPGLHSTSGLLSLIGTLINAQSLRVRQVQFHVTLSPVGSNPCACVTATRQQIAASVDAFLHGGAPPPPRRHTGAAARALARHRALAALPLSPVGADTLARARRAAARLPFRLELPAVEDAGGSAAPVALRDYLIHTPGRGVAPIYVAVFSGGQLGSYYDVQGTTWNTPPLLASPDQTISAGGRTYRLFYSGAHLQTVAWSEHHATYWVQNALADTLSNGELLAIAEQSRPVAAAGAPPASASLRLRDLRAPAPVSSAAAPGTVQTVGSIAALATLLALIPLLGLTVARRREIRVLREQLTADREQRRQLAERLARRLAPPRRTGPSV